MPKPQISITTEAKSVLESIKREGYTECLLASEAIIAAYGNGRGIGTTNVPMRRAVPSPAEPKGLRPEMLNPEPTQADWNFACRLLAESQGNYRAAIQGIPSAKTDCEGIVVALNRLVALQSKAGGGV